MATHSSILAWKIPWTEEPVRLQSMGLQRVGHDWVFSLSLPVYSCHLFLISFVSVRFIPFLSFYCAHLHEMFPWYLSLFFFKRSLVFPILLFSTISLHWSLRKLFLSLLIILWNFSFRWIYLSFSPLPFTSLLFSDTCKASSDNHFAFAFLLLGDGFDHCLLYSVMNLCPYFFRHSINQIQSLESIYHFHCIIIGIWYRSYLNAPVVFPTFFNLSLNFATQSSWSEPQGANGLVFADCIELLHLWL